MEIIAGFEVETFTDPNVAPSPWRYWWRKPGTLAEATSPPFVTREQALTHARDTLPILAGPPSVPPPDQAHCQAHGRAMVPGGIGAVRCPQPGCDAFRRTECGAFLRRLRPAGHTLVCREPVDVETWAVVGDREVYHAGRCKRHPDTARYVRNPGTRVEYRPVRSHR